MEVVSHSADFLGGERSLEHVVLFLLPSCGSGFSTGCKLDGQSLVSHRGRALRTVCSLDFGSSSLMLRCVPGRNCFNALDS